MKLLYKQLEISVQFINADANIEVKFLKLLEMSRGTAVVVCEAILQHLSKTAPKTLELEKMAGGASKLFSYSSLLTVLLIISP